MVDKLNKAKTRDDGFAIKTLFFSYLFSSLFFSHLIPTFLNITRESAISYFRVNV